MNDIKQSQSYLKSCLCTFSYTPLIYISIYILTIAQFTSCLRDPEMPEVKQKEVNVNKNSTDVIRDYANLEFPHITEDANHQIIIHRLPNNEINYSISWANDAKAQDWTCYTIHQGNCFKVWNRKNWKTTPWRGDPFQEDLSIPLNYRTTLSQYSRSGYDRGHICPSEDRVNSKEANEQTFYLSNMLPQINSFNAAVWAQMELQVRTLGGRRDFCDTLYICKGGTIRQPDIAEVTNKGLIVPKYFFVALLRVKNGEYNAIGLWFEHKPNKDKFLAKYAMSIKELQEKTHIDFFCNLSDQREEIIENQCNPALWNFK